MAKSQNKDKKSKVGKLVSSKSYTNKTLKTFVTSDVVSDAVNVLYATIGNPTSLMTTVLCFAVLVTHKKFSEGIIGVKLAGSTNQIAKLILKDTDKFLGLVTFLPTISAVHEKNRVFVSLAVIAWIFLTPAESVHGYTIMSISLLIYFRSRLLITRVMVIFLLAVLMSLEFFAIRF